MSNHEKPHFTGSPKDDADLFVSRLMSEQDDALFLEKLGKEPELQAALRTVVREIGGINDETNDLVVRVLGPTWMND